MPGYVVRLDGSASHAAAGQHLISVQWRAVDGTATILNPGSLVTNAVVNRSTTFELWGQQTDGQTGKDTMTVTVQ